MTVPRMEVKNLAAGYMGRPVIRDVSFRMEPGQILSLIGPNGAGKTTLLKTLLRQLPPIGGEILIEGKPLAGMSDREAATVLAAVLTGRPEPELMRCRELVALGRYPYTGRLGILSVEDHRKVRQAMELTGITELADRDFEQISDGQRQRVLLARAICQEPRVLLLDEPSSFLDLRHKLDFMRLLKKLAREQELAVIMSIHELTLARTFSDFVLSLKEGRLERFGPAEEVLQAPYVESLFDLEPGGAGLFL